MIRKPNRALQQSWTHRHKRRWLRRKTERKPSQLSKSGVGVEKVRFPQNSKQLGDRKCLGKPRKSFVGHPNAILFLRISRRVSFSTAESPAGGRGKAERNLSWPPYFCILRWSDRQWK